jgi:hypothetical protein
MGISWLPVNNAELISRLHGLVSDLIISARSRYKAGIKHSRQLNSCVEISSKYRWYGVAIRKIQAGRSGNAAPVGNLSLMLQRGWYSSA